MLGPCLMPVASELLIVMRLGPRTMVRNGVLIGLAGGIVAADHPGVIGVGHASRANALTARRGWLGAAGGAGLAGAVGSWFGLLDLSTADAVATRSTFNDAITCPNGCFCCRLTFGPKRPICLTYCCNGCTGFSGGGVIQTPTGTAQASYSATRSSSRAARSS